MGHRDSTPEDPDAFHAWAENYINVTVENHERWGIPLEAIEIPRQYFAAEEDLMRAEDDEPVEPSSVDGYTIYWNKKKRFYEQTCQCFGISWEEDPDIGVFDRKLWIKSLIAPDGLTKWDAFLAATAEETARRYKMPPEWIEAIKKRVAENAAARSSADANTAESLEQHLLFLFCKPQ